ncbi:DHH family phosphoesterase [Paenibacillus chitinolyticus]|uniref:DHH family phosphoesterase n=1 Tax=Paenibacillus chitinolyticus TaxID=79263 RepID=UPI0036DD7A83
MIHLYTHNDLDGVGCGILAKCAFGEEAEVRYNSVEGLNVQVQKFLELVRQGKAKHEYLYITDLSVNEQNEQELNEYAQSGGKISMIDHHKTALHFNAYPWAAVTVAYPDGRLASATSLFYEHLLRNGFLKATPALDEFVELVRQYDTWEWEANGNAQAKRLNDLFYLVSIDEFEEKMVRRLLGSEPFAFDDFEEKILDMEESKIERYIRRKRREIVQTFIHDYCVGIVHAESYHSELGNELGKEYPHLDYIAILNMGGKRVSFRTIHDHVDVSQVAGRYGGGGHAKASGCSLTDEVYPAYVAEPFSVEPIRTDAFRNYYNVKNSSFGTLYEGRSDTRFFLYPFDGKWKMEINGEEVDASYETYEEAERFIKRHYAAWLVRDDAFVKFLMKHFRKET